jgi:molybdopterin converting factor subunit 1
MNEVKILLFASLRDRIGAKNIQLELPVEATIGDLKQMLIGDHPVLAGMKNSIMAAVNREFAADDQQIPLHAEVALFPPVSGG